MYHVITYNGNHILYFNSIEHLLTINIPMLLNKKVVYTHSLFFPILTNTSFLAPMQ